MTVVIFVQAFEHFTNYGYFLHFPCKYIEHNLNTTHELYNIILRRGG